MVKYVWTLVLIALAAMLPFRELGGAFEHVIDGSAASTPARVGSRSEAGVGSAVRLVDHASRVARYRRAASQLSNLTFDSALAAGETEAALRLAYRTEDPVERTRQLIAVAEKDGHASDLWDAVGSSTKSIADLDGRLASVRQVAEARSRLALLQEELQLVLGADDPAAALQHVKRIAQAQGPRSPTWNVAAEQIEKLPDPSTRVSAYLDLGQARGDVTAYLERALQTLDEVADPAQRGSLTDQVVQHLTTQVPSSTRDLAVKQGMELWLEHGNVNPLTQVVNRVEIDAALVDTLVSAAKNVDIGQRQSLLAALLKRQEAAADGSAAQLAPSAVADLNVDIIRISELLEPNVAARELMLRAQQAQDVDSPFWQAAHQTGAKIASPDSKQAFLSELARAEFDLLAPIIEDSVLALRNASDEEIASLPADLLGSAVKPARWPQLETDGARAQLWRAASQVARFFVDEKSSHNLWKEASEVLRNLSAGNEVKADELDDLVDAMLGLDAHGTTPGALFTAIDAWGRTPGSAQLLRRLVLEGNSRAKGRVLELALDPQTSADDAQRWLTLLAEQGVVDAQLPSAMTTPGAAHVVRRLYNDLGIQPDSKNLQHVLDVARDKGLEVESATPAQLDGAIDELISGLRGLDGLDSKGVLDKLASDEGLASTYFLMNGGRSTYTETQAEFETFWSIVKEQKAAEDLIDLELFNAAAVPNEAWHEALKARRRPSPDLVWESTVGVPSIDPAGQRINDALGRDLPWLLEGHVNDAALDATRPERVHPKLAGLLENLFDPNHEHTLADFEALQKRLAQRARQMKKDAPDGETRAQWSAVISAIEGEDAPAMTAQFIPAILLKDPSLAAETSPAMQAWVARLRDISEKLAARGGSGSAAGKRLTIRFLDSVDDFIERTRFADCSGGGCFTGPGRQVGGATGHTAVQKGRAGRDPHWVLINIEDTTADAAQRNVVSSIFGSFGLFNDEPALLINGVLGNISEAEKRHIINEIALRIGKPAGLKHIVSSSTNRMDFAADGWRATGRDEMMTRPRAMRDESGEVMTQIYDDIGSQANTPYSASGKHVRSVEPE